MIKIAIDAMGGDYAPRETIKGVNMAIEMFDDIQLIVFGDEKEIRKYLVENERVSVVNTLQKIDMGVKNAIAEVRNNKETSMVLAFRAVKDGSAQGLVTAGPTQAIIAAAHLYLKRIKGMARVALCPSLPNIGGKERLFLDVGANIDLRSEHIVQFADFASIYAKETMKIEKPLVGLLNIGTEPGKGRELEKEVFELLKNDKNINFYGNVESKEIFQSECDIYVTDGFTGNMVLKTIEGVTKSIGNLLKDEISKSFSNKLGYLLMKNVFINFKKTMSADEIGGANVLGVQGVVIKAHGSSTAYAFSQAISQARRTVQADVIAKMEKLIDSSGKNE